MPAVVLASAAPAAAVSPGCITPSVEFCQFNTQQDHVRACFASTCSPASSITAITVTYTNDQGNPATVPLTPVNIPAGGTACTNWSGNTRSWNDQDTVLVSYTVDEVAVTDTLTPTNVGAC